LQVLELLAAAPDGLLAKTISHETSLNLSTCYHLLNTLVAEGYTFKHVDNHRYYLTDKVAFTDLESPDTLEARLNPHLQILSDATQETAYLSLRERDDIVLRNIVESPRSGRVSLLLVGYRGASHAMALGKAILAYMPPQETDKYLRRHGTAPLTDNTGSEPRSLLEHLGLVRQQGYSLDVEEFLPGVCCIGAPIFNGTHQVIGSLAISLSAGRFKRERTELISDVVTVARAASQAVQVREVAR